MTLQQKWFAFYGLTKKEGRRITRVWMQTLLPSTITIILYFLIFGHVIGSRVGLVDGVPYMLFIAPGLIIMPVITNSYANVVSSFYGVRWVGSVEEMLVAPMPNFLIVWGFVMGGVMRGLLNGVIVAIIGSLLSGMHIKFIFLSIVTMILTSVLFSLAGFLNAVFAKRMDDLSLVPSFILTPLIYLGGVFYNLNALPPFWREVSMVNPIHYIISLFRYATLGIGSANYWLPIGVLLCFIGALYSVCWWCMYKGVSIKS